MSNLSQSRDLLRGSQLPWCNTCQARHGTRDPFEVWAHEAQRAFEAYRVAGDRYWRELTDDERTRWVRVGREFTS